MFLFAIGLAGAFALVSQMASKVAFALKLHILYLNWNWFLGSGSRKEVTTDHVVWFDLVYDFVFNDVFAAQMHINFVNCKL